MGNIPSRHHSLIYSDHGVLRRSGSRREKKSTHSYPDYFEIESLAPDVHNTKKIYNIDRKKASSTSSQDTHRASNRSNSTSSSSLNSLKSRSKTRHHHSANNDSSAISRNYDYGTCYFEIVNGRRYMICDDSHFFLPCDDDESDRLVISHFLIKYAFNGNIISPVIQKLQAKLKTQDAVNTKPKVLDVACGPGIWVLEMATEFPNTEFHGVDLRKMYPTSIKPANTFFKRHNFLESLPYPDNTFEFVRMRLMLAFITESQLLLLLAEIHRVLKPGGYFELLDSEYLIHKPGPTSEEILNKNLKNVLHEKGIDLVASHHLSTMLMTRPTNQGFIDVHQHRIAIPIGWGGKLGDIHAQNLSSFLKSLHPTIREYICPGHQIEAIDSLIDSAIRECKTYKSHMNWFVCYGQKPADSRSLQVTPQSIKHFSSSPVMAPTFSAEGLNEILENYGPLKANDWECIDDFIDGYVD